MTQAQQQYEDALGMRDKPESEMTQEEIRSFTRTLGLVGLPFPTAVIKKNAKSGGLDWEVGMIHTSILEQALRIPSEQSLERVYGKMLRACPTPQMMYALNQLLSRLQPGSDNRLITIFGEPGSGKSHIIKEVGAIVHPQGCLTVDCGGMNMRELFWRTVIDYGQGTKEQLEKRVALGKVSQSSLDTLEAEFPGSVVRKQGRTAINWDAIGARRTALDPDSNEQKAVEDRGAAAARAVSLLKFVFEKEGISATSNAFGIKTVPGELYECFVSGRPPFLDEFNKSQRGTLDAYQTFLEWLNGNDPNPILRIPNPMATTDADSLPYIEFDRRKRKLGWFCGVAGNDPKDGSTTQVLSESMEGRLNIIRIGEPAKQDWSHRYSQIATGFPLTTWCEFFAADVTKDPTAFAKKLIAYRLLGLTAAERKLVPAHQIEALKKFQDTEKAILQLAQGYYDQQQLSRPESKKASEKGYSQCQNELAVGRKNIRVSFRTAIREHADALKVALEVGSKGQVSLPDDLAAVFDLAAGFVSSAAKPGWHKLGQNLVRVRQEAIANATVDMPLTAAALVTLWETNGVFPAELKEAKKSEKSECIVDLLKYDALQSEGFGSTEDLEKQREVLMAHLRGLHAGLKADPDKIIPLRNIALANQAILQQGGDPGAIVLPNDDLDTVTGAPIVRGEAIPFYDLPEPLSSQEYKLADFRTALAALTLPGHADKTRDRLWPKDVIERLSDNIKPSDPAEIKAVYDPIRGKAWHGFNLCILGTAGVSEKEMGYLYVIDDKERGRMLILGPQPVSPELQSALAKNGVSYVVKNNPATAEEIEDFMFAGRKVRHATGKIAIEQMKQIYIELNRAFSMICTPDASKPLEGATTTLGAYIQRGGSPLLFTSIVTKTKPKANIAL